jgi:peptidoglycan hydrolase-like protein with peptidoglycan-binding domain
MIRLEPLGQPDPREFLITDQSPPAVQPTQAGYAPSAVTTDMLSTCGTLKLGSRGSCVMVLQKWLNYVGNYGLAVDGVFGRQTQAAVMDFQRKTGLSVDGIVGKNTWYFLSSMVSAGHPLPYPTVKTPVTPPSAPYVPPQVAREWSLYDWLPYILVGGGLLLVIAMK